MSKMRSASRSLPSRIYAVVRVFLLAGIVGLLAWQIIAGWESVKSLTFQWDGLNVAGALVSGLLAYQCLFIGWLMLLRRTGHFAASNVSLYARIWWVSYLYRYVPGKILLLVERARMGSAVGIPAVAGAALTIIETILAILAGSAVSLIAISYYAGIGEQLFFSAVILSVGAVFLFPTAYRLFCGLSIVKSKFPELQSVALRSKDVLVVVVPYIFHFLLLGTSFFLISRSLQLFAWSDLPLLCGIYALSHVVSLLALIAPGGLGVREGAFAIQLGRFVPHGVAEALAIGARVWFTLIELICYVGVELFCPALPDNDPMEESQSSRESIDS
jgi:hypothetical protein